ncbi:MAG: nuclear transport factor 2 family protein [Nannocystaceae bacterium]
MPWSREELLSIVRRSPERVAAHDREGWLDLFSADAVVEDPVGAAPNPRARLGRFYDTFIAGNTIDFEVREDLVAGVEVVRDVVLHTRLSTGLEIAVPAHLLYEIADEGGAPKIRRLRAIWDLRRRSRGALAAGLPGLWTLTVVSGQMLRRQGLGGVLGYSRGLVSGIFGRGPAAIGRLAAAIEAGDPAAVEGLFVDGAAVESPIGVTKTPAEWIAGLGAGARLVVADATPAGWLTSFRFAITGGAAAGQGGVAIAAFDPRRRGIAGLRFFTRDPPP